MRHEPCNEHDGCTYYYEWPNAFDVHARTIMQADLSVAHLGHADGFGIWTRPAIPLIPGAFYIRHQCKTMFGHFGMWLPKFHHEGNR